MTKLWLGLGLIMTVVLWQVLNSPKITLGLGLALLTILMHIFAYCMTTNV